MDKKRIFALIIAAMILSAANTGVSPPTVQTHQTQTNPTRNSALSPPETAWNKTYGGSGNDRAFVVQQTSDGGYILAGATNSFGVVGYDFWLVKTDSAGNHKWNKTYGGTGNDVAESVQQTGDGGYIVAGRTSSFGVIGYDSWLVKTDASGNQQWNKTYGGTGDDYALSVQQLGDGGYIFAGRTSSFGVIGYDSWLVKTDSAGNHQWNKTYGGTGNDVADSVQRTSDGGYILAGYTSSFGVVDTDSWIVKTDASGNYQWNKTYGGTSSDAALSVQQTGDGGYITAGYTSSFGAGGFEAWLIKTNVSGNEQWNKTYGGPTDDYASSVQQTGDGGYVLAGHTSSFGAGGDDFWLVKTGDATPPSTVADLAAGSPTSNSVVLTWTAPGDEWNIGNVRGYVVKYSKTGSITEANWSSAATYTQSWTPVSGGSQETHVVSGLNASTRYWFAVRAYDEVPNYGACSNSPNATTVSAVAGGLPVEIIVVIVVVAVAVAGVVVFIAKRRKQP